MSGSGITGGDARLILRSGLLAVLEAMELHIAEHGSRRTLRVLLTMTSGLVAATAVRDAATLGMMAAGTIHFNHQNHLEGI